MQTIISYWLFIQWQLATANPKKETCISWTYLVANLVAIRAESCQGFSLQDVPLTVKSVMLFQSGRHECVRWELHFRLKLPEGRTLFYFSSKWKFIGNTPPENKFRCWQLWKRYLYNVSMLGYILEKQPCEKLWRIAERAMNKQCSDISFLGYCLYII